MGNLIKGIDELGSFIDELEKGLPVGHINAHGKQKQADGSWKYVKKGSKKQEATKKDNRNQADKTKADRAKSGARDHKDMHDQLSYSEKKKLKESHEPGSDAHKKATKEAFHKKFPNTKDNSSIDKEKLRHLQETRNDFYNRGLKEQAAKVQADIDKLGDSKSSEATVKYSESNKTYQVWKDGNIVEDFSLKERADAKVKKLNISSEVKKTDAAQKKDSPDQFKHNRMMAAVHSSEERDLLDEADDMHSSSDPQIKKDAQELYDRAEAEGKKAKGYSDKAKKLHDVSKHGSWNSTLPSTEGAMRYKDGAEKASKEKEKSQGVGVFTENGHGVMSVSVGGSKYSSRPAESKGEFIARAKMAAKADLKIDIQIKDSSKKSQSAPKKSATAAKKKKAEKKSPGLDSLPSSIGGFKTVEGRDGEKWYEIRGDEVIDDYGDKWPDRSTQNAGRNLAKKFEKDGFDAQMMTQEKGYVNVIVSEKKIKKSIESDEITKAYEILGL